LVKRTTSRGKKKQLLTPTTFSLLHATDFADRTEHDIIPPLKAGAIVLADRYIYTAFARDVARGVHPQWVRQLYQFAVKPTVAFYFRVPLEESLKRILGSRAELKYYEAGMDLNLSTDPQKSFKLFQKRIVSEYEKMVDEFGLTVMDALLPITEQQLQMREIVRPFLRGLHRTRQNNAGRWMVNGGGNGGNHGRRPRAAKTAETTGAAKTTETTETAETIKKTETTAR
jgi:dTMP kinase